jgi:hypothetical protein
MSQLTAQESRTQVFQKSRSQLKFSAPNTLIYTNTRGHRSKLQLHGIYAFVALYVSATLFLVVQHVSATMALRGSVCQCYSGSPWLIMSLLQWLSVANNVSAAMALRGSVCQCYNGSPWLSMSVLQWLSVAQYVSATMALRGSVCQCYSGFPWTLSIRKLTIQNNYIHHTTAYSQTEKWEPAKAMEVAIGVSTTNRTTSTQNISTTWNKIPPKEA